MVDEGEIVPSLEALAKLLQALASPTRLALLHGLRHPQSVGDIRVPPTLTRRGERPERALTRQAVLHHLAQLKSLGLVRQVELDGGAEALVLDHATLFALLDEVRGLAKLRPVLPLSFAAGTLVAREPQGLRLPPPPRLMVVYGREDGLAFSLAEPDRAAWRIGRGRHCEIQLDHDPFVSTEHAVVARAEEGGFTLRDTGSTNGTWLDWSPVGALPVPLRPGSVVTVGRSLLVHQPG